MKRKQLCSPVADLAAPGSTAVRAARLRRCLRMHFMRFRRVNFARRIAWHTSHHYIYPKISNNCHLELYLVAFFLYLVRGQRFVEAAAP